MNGCGKGWRCPFRLCRSIFIFGSRPSFLATSGAQLEAIKEQGKVEVIDGALGYLLHVEPVERCGRFTDVNVGNASERGNVPSPDYGCAVL